MLKDIKKVQISLEIKRLAKLILFAEQVNVDTSAESKEAQNLTKWLRTENPPSWGQQKTSLGFSWCRSVWGQNLQEYSTA